MLKWKRPAPEAAPSGAGDPFWEAVAAHLRTRGLSGRQVLAPIGFAAYCPDAREYGMGARISDMLGPGRTCLVLHKGQVDSLDLDALLPTLIRWQCIFANEVFCVFAPDADTTAESRHLEPLLERLAARLSGRPAGGAAGPARQAVYVGDNTALTRTIYGHKMLVDSRDLSLTPHLLLDGDWEPWIARVVRQHVRPGTVAIDVGANCGFYSLLLAEGVGPAGRLFAFEGNPRMATLTRKNLEINGFFARSTVMPVLVGRERGRSNFQLFEEHMGSSTMQDRSASATAFGDRVHTIEVDTIPLDEALADVPAIHFLKIDAEGAEDMIIGGAQAVIGRSPELTMVIEFAPLAGFPGYDAARAYLARFREMGFRIRRISEAGEIETASDDALLQADWSELFLDRPH
ncbi:MAG: FkbM family methyltransferase [Proteobacteria bacterium]|nr:FkbM family methyltransferase [Pseudomonadota bacterium]